MRPIDADALKKKWSHDDGFDLWVSWTDIDAMPTIDAVPVVRCGECRYRFVYGDNVRFNVCELNHNRVQSDDWFCADGERKEQTDADRINK